MLNIIKSKILAENEALPETNPSVPCREPKMYLETPQKTLILRSN